MRDQSSRIRKLVRGAGVALLLSMAIVGPTMAQEATKMTERTVSVSAVGSVSAEPDRATIATGVMTEAATAREAMTLNTTAMKRLLDGLKAAGIDPKDIQTTALQVNPRYSQARGEKPPTVTGYSALNQVRIIVRDLKKLGEILDQSITLGANQMGGVSFEVSKAETLRDEARKVAMTNARRRAELYAVAAGATVGQVLAISESVQGGAPRVFAGGRAAMAEAVAVEPGSIDLNAQVHVTYALK